MPADIIELDSSEDEAPAPKKNGFIDLTLESDGEATQSASNNIPTAPPPVAPDVIETTDIPPAQPSRSPSVASSTPSDTVPVQRKVRKKRQLNNPDVDLRIRSLSPPRKSYNKAGHAKSISSILAGIGTDETPINLRKPSFIQGRGLKALERLKKTKAPTAITAPKLVSGSKKSNKKDATSPNKIQTVRKVVDAPFESLLPTIPSNAKSPSPEPNEPVAIDEDPTFSNDEGPVEFNFQTTPTPPPLTPVASKVDDPPHMSSPAAPAAPAAPAYKPYSPTAASRGAGSSSHAQALPEWYARIPHSGWHSYSRVTPRPSLPSPPPNPAASTSVVTNGSHDEQSYLQADTTVSNRKRNRLALSENGSASPQPPPIKKRKFVMEELEDSEMSSGHEEPLDAGVSHSPDVPMEDTNAPMEDTNAPMEDTNAGVTTEGNVSMDSDEEVDQLVESASGLSPASTLTFWRTKEPGEAAATLVSQEEPPQIQEATVPETNGQEAADQRLVVESGDDSEPEGEGERSYFDPAEQKRKELLDSFGDVLDQYPQFTQGYLRPGISPADAPWVTLAPLLRRKLELERMKLMRFEYGE